MLLYLVMAFWAVIGWAFKARLAAMVARAIAPTGAMFTFLALWTGALWGKPTWGTWWVWDARLTSVLILFLMYLGIMALWRAVEDPSRAARASGSDTLWPVLRASAVSKTHLSSEVVRQLNTFRDHLNTAFGSPDMPVIPPGPDGKPWRITTRQFRRTIAWHIANRPFGTIAGMILQQALGLGLIGFVVGKVAATFWAPIFPKYVLLEPGDAVRGLVAVVVICALASTLAIRVALKVDPAAAIGG